MSKLRSPVSALALSAALTLGGCSTSRDPYAGSLSDNVGATFADCNEAEIRFLAAKHNVQLAFRPCATNKFSAFRWSPDGLNIYFQLVMSSYVMNADADDKRTTTLPLPQPTGEATWVTSTRLVVPVVGDDKIPSMAVFEMPSAGAEGGATVSGQLALHPLTGLVSAGQLQRGATPTEVYFVGRKAAEGPQKVYRFDTAEGTYALAFPWLDTSVDTFTLTPGQHAVMVGQGESVHHHDLRTGERVHTYPHAIRGSMSPQGTWVALESLGTPVSVFDQRTWDEVSDQARKREEARADAFAERLPDAFERQVRPPVLSFVEPGKDARFSITAFQGDHFQWYEAAPGWGSFFLWGFEGKQYKRNVALVNLGSHLEAMGEGRARYGVEVFTPAELAKPTE